MKTKLSFIIIALFIIFYGCGNSENNSIVTRSWEIHEFIGNNSLVLEINNHTDINYYVKNWDLLSMSEFIDEENNDVKHNYYLKETGYINSQTDLWRLYYSEADSNYTDSSYDIYQTPVTKEKLFIAKAFDLELKMRGDKIQSDSLYKDNFLGNLYYLYRSPKFFDAKSSFKDSLPINTILQSKLAYRIIVKYRILHNGANSYVLIENNSDSIYISGLPLKKVGKYIFYDKEFTDTIILRDGKIEVKYGN